MSDIQTYTYHTDADILQYTLQDWVITHAYHISWPKGPRADVKTITRDSICAIVIHPVSWEILIAFWKTCDRILFPWGGIENDETPTQAIGREIREETWYDDIDAIDVSMSPIHKYYYHPTKHINIQWTDQIAIISLSSLKHKKVTKIEHDKHDMKRIHPNQVWDTLSSPFHRIFWYRYIHRDLSPKLADQQFLQLQNSC